MYGRGSFKELEKTNFIYWNKKKRWGWIIGKRKSVHRKGKDKKKKLVFSFDL